MTRDEAIKQHRLTDAMADALACLADGDGSARREGDHFSADGFRIEIATIRAFKHRGLVESSGTGGEEVVRLTMFGASIARACQ